MSDTVTIKEFKNIQSLLSRINTYFQHQGIKETVSEKEAAEFLNWTTDYLKRKVNDGTIPPGAFIELINGERRYYLNKLVKSAH